MSRESVKEVSDWFTGMSVSLDTDLMSVLDKTLPEPNWPKSLVLQTGSIGDKTDVDWPPKTKTLEQVISEINEGLPENERYIPLSKELHDKHRQELAAQHSRRPNRLIMWLGRFGGDSPFMHPAESRRRTLYPELYSERLGRARLHKIIGAAALATGIAAGSAAYIAHAGAELTRQQEINHCEGVLLEHSTVRLDPTTTIAPSASSLSEDYQKRVVAADAAKNSGLDSYTLGLIEKIDEACEQNDGNIPQAIHRAGINR